MIFGTEDERNKAIEEFDERSNDIQKLEEIMNAEIVQNSDESVVDGGVDDGGGVIDENGTGLISGGSDDNGGESGGDGGGDGSIAGGDNGEENKEGNEVENKEGNEGEAGKDSELETLRKTVKEQSEYIKKNLGRLDSIRALEEKVAELQSKSKENVVTKKEEREAKLHASNLAKLKGRRKKLLEKYPNPEDQLDAGYVKEMNEIQSGLFDEMNNIQENMKIIHDQSNKAKSKADSYFVTREEEAEKARKRNAEDEEIKAVEKFSSTNDQFKLSKPFKDVDSDYKEYQKTVAQIYLGRDPKHIGEVNEAMNQLKRRSPGLMVRLSASGVATEPTQEMKKYLGLCELWDYWQGYRRDPLTGDYNRDKNGIIRPLMRYEPTIGKYVPDVYPSIEAAFNDQSVKNGFYMKQILNAKIEGGKGAINAIKRRDGGAAELGHDESSAGVVAASERASKRIMEIDEMEAMRLARDGDMTLLNEYNQHATTLGWPVMDLS